MYLVIASSNRYKAAIIWVYFSIFPRFPCSLFTPNNQSKTPQYVAIAITGPKHVPLSYVECGPSFRVDGLNLLKFTYVLGFKIQAVAFLNSK